MGVPVRLTSRPHGLIVNGMWSRRLFPFWFFGLLVVAIIGHSLAIGFIWGVVMAGYVMSVVIHSRTRCTHCNGTGELRGSRLQMDFPPMPAVRRGADHQAGRYGHRPAARAGAGEAAAGDEAEHEDPAAVVTCLPRTGTG